MQMSLNNQTKIKISLGLALTAVMFKTSKVNAAALTTSVAASVAHWTGVVDPIIGSIGIIVTAVLGTTMIVLNCLKIREMLRNKPTDPDS